MGKLDFFLEDVRSTSSVKAWEAKANSHIRRHNEQSKKRTNKQVTISTIHRAKGLEWNCVILVDCCHGTIPISKAETKEAIEEERRLFYVAVTRAREKLYLLNYSGKPGAKGKISHVKESAFLSELKGFGYKREMRDNELDNKRKSQMEQAASDFYEGDIRHFRAGMQVNHKTYGSGVVISKTLFFVNVRFESGSKIFPLDK